MKIPKDKKIYFASDQHFGAPTAEASKKREKVFLDWLNAIEKDALALFLLGDLFDFWFHYFVGNHDLWMRDYFETELRIPVYHKPKDFILENTSFLIGHGDGLGPNDKGYKRMKKLFTNPLAKWFYRMLHPDLGMRIGHYFSVKNKLISGDEDVVFLGEDKEWLAIYTKRKLEQQHRDYFLFGHRHLPLEIELNSKSKYINLGDWISHFTYGIFDGKHFELKKWEVIDD